MRRDNPTAASTNAPSHDASRRVIFFEAAFGCSAPLFFAVTYTNSLAMFLIRLEIMTPEGCAVDIVGSDRLWEFC